MQAGIPIGGYFRNGYDRPMYTYSLKISLDQDVYVEQLQITSEVQVAPLSLPALEIGENEVCYLDETSGDRRVEVLFGYDPLGRQNE